MFDSMKFWKRKEEEPTGTPQWNDALAPHNEPQADQFQQHQEPTFQMPAVPSFSPPAPAFQQLQQSQPQSSPPSSQPVTSRDIELITAKLDAIKAQLEALNMRVAHLERIAEAAQGPPQKGW